MTAMHQILKERIKLWVGPASHLSLLTPRAGPASSLPLIQTQGCRGKELTHSLTHTSHHYHQRHDCHHHYYHHHHHYGRAGSEAKGQPLTDSRQATAAASTSDVCERSAPFLMLISISQGFSPERLSQLLVHRPAKTNIYSGYMISNGASFSSQPMEPSDSWHEVRFFSHRQTLNWRHDHHEILSKSFRHHSGLGVCNNK